MASKEKRANNKKGRRISHDLMISLLSTVIIASLLTVSLIYWQLYRNINDDLTRTAETYLTHLENSLKEPIWTFNTETVSYIADSYMNTQLVARLKIVETTGSGVFYERQKPNEKELLEVQGIVKHGDDEIARIELGLARRVAQKETFRALQAAVALISVIVLVMVSVIMVFIRYLVKTPLQDLLDSIEQIAVGRYDYHFKTFRHLEFRSITQKFEKMARRIKTRETSLQESEVKYRELTDLLPQTVFEVDTRGRLTYANEFGFRAFGYTEADFKIGLNILDMLVPEQRERVGANIGRVMAGENVPTEEYTALRKDGTTFPAIIYANQIRRSGEALGLRGIVFDITERKQAEETLRASEEKYRILVENASDAISVAQDGVIKFLNQKTVAMSGYSKAEIAKIPFFDLIHPEDRDMVIDRHLKRLAGEKPPSTYSFRIINKTGRAFWVELNTVFINWEGRPATLNFIRDITQQRKLEAQFQYAQRMESLGTLAGGIAHDFNNLLMGIQGNASLILIDKESGNPNYEKLKNIEQYVQSGTDLTKQLLGFARGGKYETKPINLNDLIKNQNRLFGRTKKEINVHGRYAQDLWFVEADQGQIQQVLMNLYVNAWQAMPGGGDLYTHTENADLDENYVKPFKIEPGRYVKISVTDTGMGMDDRTKKRVFEPFFTTKGMGRGTGLGLASVYGIVKNHGGFINIYSEKGEGTTFNIYLPASEKEVIEGKKPSEEVVKGEGTILLVDDEEMITDVGRQLLEELGYKVMVAKSGREAVTLYEKNKADIDIVILDMIMSDMSGGKTYDRLKEINPDIKALLSSGYSINGRAQQILDHGCNGFIQKPFNMKALSLKISEILDMGQTDK